jgi:hypothetical protein
MASQMMPRKRLKKLMPQERLRPKATREVSRHWHPVQD